MSATHRMSTSRTLALGIWATFVIADDGFAMLPRARFLGQVCRFCCPPPARALRWFYYHAPLGSNLHHIVGCVGCAATPQLVSPDNFRCPSCPCITVMYRSLPKCVVSRFVFISFMFPVASPP